MKKRNLTIKSKIISISILFILILSGSNASAAARDKEKECDATVFFQEYNLLAFSFFDYRLKDRWWDDFWAAQRWGQVCQWMDLDSARKKRSALRKQLRKSFLSCSSRTKINDLKKRYYKTEAELYYVENGVSWQNGEFILNPNIEKQMIEYFSNDKQWIEKATMEGYLKDFATIYRESFRNYNSEKCEDPAWGLIKEKVKELQENDMGFKSVLEELDKQRKKVDKRQKQRDLIKQARKAQAEKEGKDTGILGSIADKFALTVNGVEPSDFLEDLVEDFEGNVGDNPIYKKSKEYLKELIEEGTDEGNNEKAPSVTTFDDVNKLTKTLLEKKNEAIADAEISLEYEVTFQNSGAEVAASFVNLLKQTNETIKVTNTILEDLNTCARSPLEKQCQNK